MKTHIPLSLFVRFLQKVHDPCSEQGQSHPFSTVLALFFLGRLAKISSIADLQLAFAEFVHAIMQTP